MAVGNLACYANAMQDSITSPSAAKIHIEVQTFPLAEHHQPDIGRFVFGYHISIYNRVPIPVQLLDRYWLITDGLGRQQVVRGKGVIGQQPIIEAGESYEYSSFCPLTTTFGYMEGSYGMRDANGCEFRVPVSLFVLGERQASSLN